PRPASRRRARVRGVRAAGRHRLRSHAHAASRGRARADRLRGRDHRPRRQVDTARRALADVVKNLIRAALLLSVVAASLARLPSAFETRTRGPLYTTAKEIDRARPKGERLA